MRTFAKKPQATQQTASAKSTIPNRAHFGQSRDISSILHLQRTIGNQSVQRLLQANLEGTKVSSGTTTTACFAHDFSRIPLHAKAHTEIRPKLTISTPGDLYEQEADHVADQLMRMSESQHIWPLGERRTMSHTKQPSREHEDLQTTRLLQAHDMRQFAAPPIVHEVLATPGQVLEPATKSDVESRFGHDFSAVRLYIHPLAAESAEVINARAYTVGSNIVFGSQQYAPGTNEGKKLLFHELTHVIQQNRNIDRPNNYLSRLTQEDKTENLKSKKYAGTRRLEKAFDNDPPLGIGESEEAVRLVQEGLIAEGFDMPASTRPTGELDGVFGAETFTVVKKFQAKYGLRVDGIVGRETMGKLDELELYRKPQPPPRWSPAIDRIDIIDSPSGAVGCFGPIMGDSNLNNPGPFNNRSTDVKYPYYGEVTNVHQVHFHLDRGESSRLIPERFIDATYSHAWIQRPWNGPDGPQPFEICRPSLNKLAVADGPGKKWLDDLSYPFKLNAHFYLMVSDMLGHRVAQVEYNVEIEKTNKNNIPNEVNRIYPTKKRDLIRNRDL